MRIAHLVFALDAGNKEYAVLDLVNFQADDNTVGLFIVNNVVDQ